MSNKIVNPTRLADHQLSFYDRRVDQVVQTLFWPALNDQETKKCFENYNVADIPKIIDIKFNALFILQLTLTSNEFLRALAYGDWQLNVWKSQYFFS